MVDVLQLSDVRLTLGGRTILDGLSLTAALGSVTALLGPNGAGKTTTIRCCTGLLTPDSGHIDLLGRTPTEPGAMDAVGLMPQATGTWSGVTPVQLLTYLGRLYANPHPVPELMAAFALEGFARTPYRRLSGGQQQAVNMAGAVIGRPQFVFLDEPTAGLDPHTRRRTWDLISGLAAAGVGVLLTTHAMDEAERLADQVWIMDAGRITAHGTVAELTANGPLEEVFLRHTSGGTP